MNPKVDFYFQKNTQWQKELEQLRAIILDCGLTEELKWGCPAYTINKSNIVLLHVFKSYCAILFFKGALLKDPDNILIQQSENTQATKQIRFTNLMEVIELAPKIKTYVKAAIEIEKAGLKVEFKKTDAFKMPHEFKERLEAIPALKKAFESLTPGRQRAYLLHFSAPKQSSTRLSRIDKAMDLIMHGKGLND
ncbi:MAG TPA: DUF1801 domain-containing protein [Bacteroidia bacterium]